MNCKHCQLDLTNETYVQEITIGQLCLTCFNLWQDEQISDVIIEQL